MRSPLTTIDPETLDARQLRREHSDLPEPDVTWTHDGRPVSTFPTGFPLSTTTEPLDPTNDLPF